MSVCGCLSIHSVCVYVCVRACLSGRDCVMETAVKCMSWNNKDEIETTCSTVQQWRWVNYCWTCGILSVAAAECHVQESVRPSDSSYACLLHNLCVWYDSGMQTAELTVDVLANFVSVCRSCCTFCVAGGRHTGTLAHWPTVTNKTTCRTAVYVISNATFLYWPLLLITC